MTFETVAQSDLTAPRPTQTDAQSAAEKSRQARGLLGAGVLNADEFRLNQLMANGGGSASATGASASGAGSMPLHKPKFASMLVQFTLDVRVVARVTDRVRSSRASVAERELTLPQPVVVWMPQPVARRLLAAYPEAVADPRGNWGCEGGWWADSPAWAGTTNRPRLWSAGHWDHPRTRGDHRS
ncbi:hypothetical protein AAGT00_21630 [Streptomyces cavourensis]